MKKLILIPAILALVWLTACKDAKDKYRNDKAFATVEAEFNAIPVEGQDFEIKKSAIKNEDAREISPKIIKTASISMEVLDYGKSKSKIDSIIALSKAYVTSEGFQQTDVQMGNNMEIKVPSIGFDKLLQSLASIAKRVDYQNISMQDVTEEYIDIKSRLENKQKVEKTYQNLLKQTTNIEDILKIENKLGDIRSEIESIQGRMKYIDYQVSLCTISLYFYQKLEFKYTPEEMPSFWQKVKESIDGGWKGIVWFVVLLIKLWPLWVIGAIACYVWVKIKASRKTKKSEKKKKKDKKKSTKTENFQNPYDSGI